MSSFIKAEEMKVFSFFLRKIHSNILTGIVNVMIVTLFFSGYKFLFNKTLFFKSILIAQFLQSTVITIDDDHPR